MSKTCLLVMASTSVVIVSNSFAQYATLVGAVVSPAYTNPLTALGEPSRTGDSFGAPLTPVSPAVQTNQIICVDFSSDPLFNGWRAVGNTNLFRWNPGSQHLDVTWDSAQTNSYFQYPLGTIVNRWDDFSVAFDLVLKDVAAGFDPNKPSTFPLAIGLQNKASATATNFLRSTGHNSPNLVEFDFFPDTGFGPTVWPAVWSTNSSLTYNGPSDYTLVDLPVGVAIHIAMTYTASNSTLITTIKTNGAPIAVVNPVTLSSKFTDFWVDTFAVESYAETRPAGPGAGSLLAHGIVDNVRIIVPPPPVQLLVGSFASGQWQTTFLSRTNWAYVLEGTRDFQSWSEVSPHANGTGGALSFRDTNAAPWNGRFYRIKSQRFN